MQMSDGSPISLAVLVLYGLIISFYLIILRLLLDMLQQLGRHHTQKSIIDVDIHRTMTSRVENSMHTFDITSVAVTIAKGGISVVAMAAIIVLLVIKVGLIATILFITIVILMAWAMNVWLRSREKPGDVRDQIRKYVLKSGSVGMVLLLSIILVALLFVMILLH